MTGSQVLVWELMMVAFDVPPTSPPPAKYANIGHGVQGVCTYTLLPTFTTTKQLATDTFPRRRFLGIALRSPHPLQANLSGGRSAARISSS